MEGSAYFQYLSKPNPADATAHALAGFFQVRAGHDVAAAIAKLDDAATMDFGLPQYFRGLALAELLPGAGPSEARLAAADTGRAEQVIADLEFVLAVRDQFPVFLLRAAYQGLARAYRAVRREQEAAEALRRSGLGPVAMDRPPMFTSFSVTERDGMRVSAPSVLSPAPDVHVAQSYDLGDFAFIQTSAGLVAIDAGTSPDRVLAAMVRPGSIPSSARRRRQCGGCVVARKSPDPAQIFSRARAPRPLLTTLGAARAVAARRCLTRLPAACRRGMPSTSGSVKIRPRSSGLAR